MRSNMTISAKIRSLAIVLVTFTAILGAVSLYNLSRLDASVNTLSTDALPGLEYSAAITRDLFQFRGDVWRHISAPNAREMAAIEQEQAAIREKLDKDMTSYQSTITQADDHANFEKLRPQLAEYFQIWETVVRPVSRTGTQNSRAYRLSLAKAQPLYLAAGKSIEYIVEWNTQWAQAASIKAAAASTSFRFWSWTLLASSLLLGTFFSWWIIRDLNGKLRPIVEELSLGGDQVAAAAGQIASSSQGLSQGASEQAASLEEISASMEEMSAMTKRNAENSNQARATMQETAAQVERSNRALQEMVASMSSIKESSEKVAKINKTIDEIAFQTNILALNAAVEAARAGNAGMGFAVVADEVRNLAQRSAVAAKNTAALIEEAIANSTSGAEKLDRVGEAIRAITESSAKVQHLVDEVNEASHQQTQGIDQVALAITQVSTVTQSAAANAEQSAASSQELSTQSETVRRLVDNLKALAGGGRNGDPVRTATAFAAQPCPAPHISVSRTGVSAEEIFPLEPAGKSGGFEMF